MNKILITGASGQLGSEINVLSKNIDSIFLFTDYLELDITCKEAVTAFINENTIDIIINCAAYTAVDKAEEEEEKANAINCNGAKNLAEAAKAVNAQLIHISTDYVFDGTNCRPYEVNDLPNPQSVYGRTKLNGDQAILEIAPGNSAIIRTSWVYSSFGNNFVKTMISLGREKESLSVISDQIGSPTYARHLANAILDLIPQLKNTTPELLHYSNKGACSWYDFAYEIFNMAEIDIKLNAISSEEYPTAAKRPFYSLLSKKVIKSKYNILVPHWKDGLKECLVTMKEYGQLEL